MRISIEKMQEILVRCLARLGCSKIGVLVIMAELQNPDDTWEMLTYISENPKATPAELYEMSSKISSARDRLMEAEEAENPENPEEAED